MYFLEFIMSLFGYRRQYNTFLRPFTRRRGKRARIPKATRDILLAAAGYKCQNPRCSNTDNLQVDHVVPRSWGGSDEIWNLQILCGSCNRRKSNKNSKDYRWWK